MTFSGGGFHFFVSVKYPNILQNKKAAIYNAVVDVCDKVGLKIGINEHSDMDGHVVGNIAQLIRVPNTWNLKRKKFCIPVCGKDLETSLENIQNLSTKQRHINGSWIYDGSKEFDLAPYDKEKVERNLNIDVMPLEGKSGIEVNTEEFLPCMKSLLTKKLIKHKQRYYLILYCKELGIPLNDTVALLRKFLPQKTFHHCVHEEHQPMFIYKRSNLIFPKCETLELEELCSEKRCKYRNNL